MKDFDKLSENVILKRLHDFIDKKFNRKDRTKKVSPVLLENKMTLWNISEEFKDVNPELMAKLLRKLVTRGSVASNIDEDGIYPFDAYFIPVEEIINKEHFKIYLSIKKILHNC